MRRSISANGARWLSLAILSGIVAPAVNATDPVKREDLRYGGKSFKEWHHVLRTELKPESRIEALAAVAAFGKRGYGAEATDAVLELMREYTITVGLNIADEFFIQQAPVPEKALAAIMAIGDPAVAALEKSLLDKSPDMRRFAVAGIANLSCHSPGAIKPALPRLTIAIKDSDTFVVVGAVIALTQLGQAAKEAESALKARLAQEQTRSEQVAFFLEHPLTDGRVQSLEAYIAAALEAIAKTK